MTTCAIFKIKLLWSKTTSHCK